MNESDVTAITLKLAEGTPIDWGALKTEASEAHARLFERFQQIEALARLGMSALPERDQLDSIRDAVSLEERTPLRWGHLEILEKIGRGSYGDVYRARDTRLDRVVALKLLRGGGSEQSRESEIIEEARLLARVHHPNVVSVFGAEEMDGRVGVWMEFVHGQTLEQELQTSGPLGAKEVREVGITLCSALTAIHDAGLTHRDIKTQNVMRDRQGRLVITDFGAGQDLRLARMAQSSVRGTRAYVAPEILTGGEATTRSEIYSLGVLLFRLATQSLPYRGVRTGKANGRFKGDELDNLPRALRRVIRTAISTDPTKRYRGPAELCQDLRGTSFGLRSREIVVWMSAFLAAAAVAGFWLSGAIAPDEFAISPQQEAQDRLLGEQLRRLDEPYARMRGLVASPSVSLLERQVDANPDNLAELDNLLVLYLQRLALAGLPPRPDGPRPPAVDVDAIETSRRTRILWLIEHHPESTVAGSFEARLFRDDFNHSYPVDVDGYYEAKRLWLGHAERDGVNTAILDHAASFFEWADPPLAERLLLKAQRFEPASSWWSVRLGALYANVVVAPDYSIASHTATPLFPRVRSDHADGTAGPEFSVGARTKVGASTDPSLLIAAASTFQRMHWGWSSNDPSPNVWARQFYERALQFASYSIVAHGNLLPIKRAELSTFGVSITWGTRDWHGRMLEVPKHQQLAAFAELMQGTLIAIGDLDARLTPDAKARAEGFCRDAEQLAREALKSAAAGSDDPERGTVIYVANMTLGSLALLGGDKAAAMKYLKAASRAPQSEWLAYSDAAVNGFPSSGDSPDVANGGLRPPALARKLLSAGEYAVVADFFERMARTNLVRRKDLLTMTAQIRWDASSRHDVSPPVVH